MPQQNKKSLNQSNQQSAGKKSGNAANSKWSEEKQKKGNAGRNPNQSLGDRARQYDAANQADAANQSNRGDQDEAPRRGNVMTEEQDENDAARREVGNARNLSEDNDSTADDEVEENEDEAGSSRGQVNQPKRRAS